MRWVLWALFGPDQPTEKQVRRMSFIGDAIVLAAAIGGCYWLGVTVVVE